MKSWSIKSMSDAENLSVEGILKGSPADIANALRCLYLIHTEEDVYAQEHGTRFKGIMLCPVSDDMNSNHYDSTLTELLKNIATNCKECGEGADAVDELMRIYGNTNAGAAAEGLVRALHKIASKESLDFKDKDALAHFRDATNAIIFDYTGSIEYDQRNMKQDGIASFIERVKGDRDEREIQDHVTSYYSENILTYQSVIKQVNNHVVPLLDGLCRKLGIQQAPYTGK